MKIVGIPVGNTMPRTNYEQTDPSKADFLKGKEVLDQNIADAKKAGTDAKTAADGAKTAADNAQTTANNALPKAGGEMTGDIVMGGKKVTGLADPSMYTDAATKGYVDSRRKVFNTTLAANGWVGDAAPYTQTIAMDGILESDTPHYGPVYSDNAETALLEKENWALVDDMETADGSVTFTAFEEKPVVDIAVQMEVFR